MQVLPVADATWRLGHRPALDGLRGLAVLLVIGTHYGVSVLRGANTAGVLTFFVLSGFLITALLREEPIELAAFYRRRAARLLPALVTMVAFVAIVSLLAGILDVMLPSIGASLFYVANIWQPDMPLTPTWSLAIEEQFYAVWPLILLLAGRWATAVVIVVLLVPFGGNLSAFAAVASGCTLAFLAPRLHLPGWLGWLGLAGLLTAAAVPNEGHAGVPALLLVVISATLIVAVTASGAWASPLTLRPLRDVGRISYGLYLWHMPMLWLLPALPALIASFVVAILSWHGMEKRIIRWARRQPGDPQVGPVATRGVVDAGRGAGVVAVGDQLDAWVHESG